MLMAQAPVLDGVVFNASPLGQDGFAGGATLLRQ
jgi:hypothetical protein